MSNGSSSCWEKKLMKSLFYFGEIIIIPLCVHSYNKLSNKLHWAYKFFLLLTTREKFLGRNYCTLASKCVYSCVHTVNTRATI